MENRNSSLTDDDDGTDGVSSGKVSSAVRLSNLHDNLRVVCAAAEVGAERAAMSGRDDLAKIIHNSLEEVKKVFGE